MVAKSLALRGSLLKVEAVLKLARDGGRARLKDDSKGFLNQNGISLTNDEQAALADILNGTSNSVFAEPPPGAPFDKMKMLRKMWSGQ